ncbi:MAG TPA: type II secretion system F family protein [Candidatus Thermoplasmatota archaeon]|jgi:flagellar protein FlaJ|nr:type II secretion system F family protein [Candidatus Thermoplasmatota archaeon]
MKRKGKVAQQLEELSPQEPSAQPEAALAPAEPARAVAPVMVTPLVAPPAPKQDKKKGPPPKKPGLTDFQRTAFRLFGNHFTRRPLNQKLAEQLAKSRSGVRVEALESAALLSAIIAGVSGLLVAVFMFAVFVPLLGVELPMMMTLLLAMSPLIMAGVGYMAVAASPGARAKSRARDIDNRLPYALNYIAAMASAGVNVDQIFRSLGEQRIYGEVAKEADAIYRDISLFGKDTVTAFKRAIRRTPSQRFAELLQGAITTFGSGGDLQLYFSSKAQRYMIENRQEQKQFLDTMGLMAETYVTTAVAGPLFLMVMMAIMGMLSGGGPGQLYMIVYLMLPTANFGFVYGLGAMTPKV